MPVPKQENFSQFLDTKNIFCPCCGSKTKTSKTNVYYDFKSSNKSKNRIVFYCKNHKGFLYFVIEPFIINDDIFSFRVLIIYDEYEPIKHRPFFCCICGTKWKSIKNSKPMMVFNQSLSEKKAGRSVFVCLNHKSPLTMLREPFSMLKSLPAIIRYTRHDKKPLR